MRDLVLACGVVLAASSGVGVVANRRPLYSALSLVVNMLSLALIFLVLSAQFLAVAQVIVYAGAVMVLFVFVIALLNPGRDEAPSRDPMQVAAGLFLAAMFVAVSALALAALHNPVANPYVREPGGLAAQAPPPPPLPPEGLGSIQATGHALFVDFAYPFEATSLILVVAAVGAVYLSRGR